MCSEDLRTKERSQMEAEVHRRESTKGGFRGGSACGEQVLDFGQRRFGGGRFFEFSYEVLRGKMDPS